MQVGIIGLPNVGKSTIFNTLTKASAEVANYPFCTIEPNIGLINVPDDNLAKLSKIYGSGKITNAGIKVLDVAGLVKGASNGEGLGNKFLSHIREVDVIAHIVRCFYDENVLHIAKDINPVGDIEIINTELLLADIEILERKKEKLVSSSKTGKSDARADLEVVNYLIDKFNKGSIDISGFNGIFEKNKELFLDLNLLGFKPALYVANMNEDTKSIILYNDLIKKIGTSEIIKIYGKVENELLELPENERDYYRKELGVEEDGLKIFIKKCYSMLNLITFYTINENEARAWPLIKGSTAIEAAGKVHSDMQKGFIKAEVINCSELLKLNSIHKAREEGRIRIEGRDYIVADEDVIQIKFSV